MQKLLFSNSDLVTLKKALINMLSKYLFNSRSQETDPVEHV